MNFLKHNLKKVLCLFKRKKLFDGCNFAISFFEICMILCIVFSIYNIFHIDVLIILLVGSTLILLVSRLKTMDLILVLLGMYLLYFNHEIIQIFKEYGAIPDTLVTYLYIATTGELGVMGLIAKAKKSNKEHQWQEEEKKEQSIASSNNIKTTNPSSNIDGINYINLNQDIAG